MSCLITNSHPAASLCLKTQRGSGVGVGDEAAHPNRALPFEAKQSRSRKVYQATVEKVAISTTETQTADMSEHICSGPMFTHYRHHRFINVYKNYRFINVSSQRKYFRISPSKLKKAQRWGVA